MFNLDIFKDIILESRAAHSSLPKEIIALLLTNYELLADPIETTDSVIYIIKQTKEIK